MEFNEFYDKLLVSNIQASDLVGINNVLKNICFNTYDMESLKRIKNEIKWAIISSGNIESPKSNFFNYFIAFGLGFFAMHSITVSLIYLPLAVILGICCYYYNVKPIIEYVRNIHSYEEQREIAEKHIDAIESLIRIREVTLNKDIYRDYSKNQILKYTKGLIDNMRLSITEDLKNEYKALLLDFENLLNSKELDYDFANTMIDRCEDLNNKINDKVVSKGRTRTRILKIKTFLKH